jgi:hypothetical protein
MKMATSRIACIAIQRKRRPSGEKIPDVFAVSLFVAGRLYLTGRCRCIPEKPLRKIIFHADDVLYTNRQEN